MPASGQLGDTPRLRSVPNARTGTFLAHRLFASRQFHQHLSEVLALEELEEGKSVRFRCLAPRSLSTRACHRVSTDPVWSCPQQGFGQIAGGLVINDVVDTDVPEKSAFVRAACGSHLRSGFSTIDPKNLPG